MFRVEDERYEVDMAIDSSEQNALLESDDGNNGDADNEDEDYHSARE